jgi:tetratricopeptide (TPR) repeat protein
LHWIETRAWALSLLLVLATVALYYPVHSHPFLNYDDTSYVTDNRHVQAGVTWETVEWAFTTYYEANWHPVTWLSHALDCQLFDLHPAGHHNVNLLLHVINVLLLFWLLYQATGFAGRSFMVAALFALHPINVQTVAWVAERKNLLSMLFFLLALGAYQWYASEPRVWRYGVVALLFAMGLMSKPQVITLPCILLLWDYWPLRRMFASARTPSPVVSPAVVPPKRFIWLIVEKLPLFAIAAADAILTMHAQRMGGARNWFPRSIRLGNAILSYTRYVGKAFWPSRLALFYPHPGDTLRISHVLGALAFLLVVTGVVAYLHRLRYLPVGWLWFVGALVPMIGLIQVGIQAMADRYAYLPFIGLFIMVCWAAADLSEQLHVPPAWLAGVGIVVLLALTVTARIQLDLWGNNVTVWAHTLEVTGPNFIAENSVGVALEHEGKMDEAVKHFRAAVTIFPDDAASNLNLAEYDRQQGNLVACIERCKRVLGMAQFASQEAQAYAKMALAYHALGDSAQERQCLEKVQEILGGR